jgi:hypothetical protein
MPTMRFKIGQVLNSNFDNLPCGASALAARHKIEQFAIGMPIPTMTMLID